MRTVIAFAVVLLLCSGVSQSQDATEPPAGSDSKAPWSKAVEGLQCWLQPDRKVWKSDEVPSFRLHVRDQGLRDLEIHMAECACKLEFDGVWYDWSAPVSIPGGTWPAGRQYEDFEVRVALDPQWKSENNPIPLLPGKHKIRVAYVTLDREHPVRVVSNVVEIQLTGGELTPQKDTDQTLQDLKEEVKVLRQQLEETEKRLEELEKSELTFAWGKATNGLQAGLALRPANQRSFRVGETARFVVTVRNGGDHPIEMRYLAVEEAARMGPSVLDGAGERPPMSGPAYTSVGGQAISTLSLAPGQEVEFASPELVFGPVGESRVKEQTTVQGGAGKYRVSYHVYFVNPDDTGNSLTTGAVEVEVDRPANQNP